MSLIFGHWTAVVENLEEVDEEGAITWSEFSERHAEDEEGSGEQKGRAQEEKGEHEIETLAYSRTRNPLALWTRIKVSGVDRPLYERMDAFLTPSRSNSFSLDIHIDSESSGDLSDDEEAPTELSNADLEIQYSSFFWLLTFLFGTLSDPSAPPASQLQVLRLYHHEEPDGDITTFPKSEFSDHLTLFSGCAPRLQNVSLWSVHVDWTQSCLHSPNLVELELAYHTPSVRPNWLTFSAMLRIAAPTLEKLCLGSSSPSGSPFQLQLAFSPPLEAIPMLRKICMPSRKALIINPDNGDYTDLMTYFVRPTTTTASSTNVQRWGMVYSASSVPTSLTGQHYPAGQMYKALRITKESALVRLTQQVNLTSALCTALLMLPSQYTPRAMTSGPRACAYEGEVAARGRQTDDRAIPCNGADPHERITSAGVFKSTRYAAAEGYSQQKDCVGS
ncbi:hypothetical protein EV401DRAFT_1894952 [Pisolithus croceorrhizus]|nr:hypothetical protein EV401DRAFT_1894952 [Pisolithus croceorrhizus]